MKNRRIILLLLSGAVLLNAGQTNEKGKYFTQKEYVNHPLPVFEQVKDNLPRPVLSGNREWVEMYWKSWEIAFQKCRQVQEGSPFVSNYYDEAFSDNIFQWDTIFIVMFARYANHIFPAVQSLDNFYCRQHENGFICRELRESDGSDFYYFLDFLGTDNLINPPLFSWAEIESFKMTGDPDRYSLVLPVLEKYAGWLEQYRKKEGTAHSLYWNTGLGGGGDNTPRNGSGWVCMSSQMVILYRDLAQMYRQTGQEEKSVRYERKAKETGALINTWMWNEADGLYYDVDDAGKHVKWKTIGCFWPLLAGIADEGQAEKLMKHLSDPNSFWRLIPFPSHAADEKTYHPKGDYWRGGVWAPTNYMIIKGLQANGYEILAKEASEKYVEGLYRVFENTGTLWENYAPDFYEPGNKSRPDFVGWTGIGPIALLFENIIGIRPDAAEKKVTWVIQRDDKHGIENLTLGDINTSLVCDSKNEGARKITVLSNDTFELIVENGGVPKTFTVNSGRQVFDLNE